MSNEQVTGEATPNEELRRQILSPCVAKNEREWWAASTIERLEFELNSANERIKRLEEAGDELGSRLRLRDEADSDAYLKWLKAKEAKL